MKTSEPRFTPVPIKTPPDNLAAISPRGITPKMTERVLVVDDSVTHRKLLVAILHAEGYATLEATDGEKALQLLEKETVDVVVSDILMPNMDGFRFCYELRKSLKHSTLPFIFLTGAYTSSSDETLALELGADKFIKKPFLAKDVAQVLREVLDNSSYQTPRIITHPKTIDVLEEYRDALVCKLEEKTIELQQTTEELRTSEELFRLITENAADLIAVLDLDGKRLYNSPSYKAFFGNPVGLRGTDSFQEIHPDDRENIRRVFQETVATGVGQRTEYRFVLSDGSVRQIESQGNVVVGPDGKPAQIVVVSRDITERKRVEEARWASEARYRTLFEYAPDGIVIADSQSCYIDANASICRMLGYTHNELVGLHASDIVVRNEIQYIDPALNAIKESGNYHREWQFRRKDGSVFPAEVMATMMPDGNLLGMIRDITGRKIAEEEIRNLNRVYAVLSNINQIIVRVHDPEQLFKEACRIAVDDGNFRMAWIGMINPATQRVDIAASAGMTDDYLSKINIDLKDEKTSRGPSGRAIASASHVTSNDLENDEAMLPRWNDLRALDIRSSAAFPLKVFGKVWGVFCLYSSEIGFFDVGEIKLLDELALDVSFAIEFIEREAQRKLAEEALRNSERQLNLVHNNVSDSIFYLAVEDGEQFRFLSINPAFTKAIGLAGNQIVGKLVQDIIPEPALQTVIGNYRKAIVEKKSIAWEETSQYPAGTKYGEVSVTPVFDQNGTCTNLIGTVHDTTERKSLEQQLRQAQKLESLGTLAGGIAHDFNNILGIIMGHASLLSRRGVDTDKLARGTAAITQASQRGAGLVRQLLTFARKTEPLFEAVSVNDIIFELVKLLEETFPSSISISHSLATGLGSIIADSDQLHQMILNLCVNARDAMPDGGSLSITTSVSPLEIVRREFTDASAHTYICISTSDTGTGMDETTRQRIFEPFFTTKGVGKGTGLGLAVVYGIVKSLNGYITVESSPGKGTTFRLYLPVVEHEIIATKMAITTPANIPGGNETILVVEDEEMLMDLIATLLESKGYCVLRAKDGDEAVDVYKEHMSSISLVLTDLGLPKCDGHNAFLKMKEINPAVRAIIATGYVRAEQRAKILESGVKSIIVKPFVPMLLMQSVRDAIDKVE